MGGDFTVVQFPCERLGCVWFSMSMMDFSNFISELRLVGFPLDGESSLGQIIIFCHQCQKLIDSLHQRIGEEHYSYA